MVASPATIELIDQPPPQTSSINYPRRQIAMGWPKKAADVPSDMREFITFADELIGSDGLPFKGQRVLVPHEARPEILKRFHSNISARMDAFAALKKAFLGRPLL